MDALPAQVRAQAEEADRMLQALANPERGEPPTEQQPNQAEPAPAAQGQKEVQQPSPATGPANPGGANQDQPADEATWEQRYRTLQGMLAAQRKRDEKIIQSLEEQLRETRERLTALESAAPKPSAQGTQDQPTQPLVTDKDVEAFGGDLIDLAKRVAQEVVRQNFGEVQKLIAAKDAEIAKLREQIGGVSEQTKVVTEHTYLADLARLVPDWEAVNTSQAWLDWLAQPDPVSGRPRQDFLDDAFARKDALRTAEIFRAFKGAMGIGQQPPAPQQPSANTELQRQVQPTSSHAAPAAPGGDPNGKVWTAAEMQRFYDDVARGAYRGREQEQARISAEIDAAIAAGRVRP